MPSATSPSSLPSSPLAHPSPHVAATSGFSLRDLIQTYRSASLRAGVAPDNGDIGDEDVFPLFGETHASHSPSSDVLYQFQWTDPAGALKTPSVSWKPPPPAKQPPPCEVSSKPRAARRERVKSHRGGKKKRKLPQDSPPLTGYLGPQHPLNVAQRDSLRSKMFSRGTALQAQGFSLAKHGNRTQTGWHGRPPPLESAREIVQLCVQRTLGVHLRTFFRVPFDITSSFPTFFVDQDGRTAIVRTGVHSWLKQEAPAVWAAIQKLLMHILQDPHARLEHQNGSRGPHFPSIMGFYRPYHSKPTLTGFHAKHMELVQEFIDEPVIARLIGLANELVRIYFPGIAQRYQASVDYHENLHGIPNYFGMWYNFCVNGAFLGQQRVHTIPHADHKNVVGVCLVFVYEIPGSSFDHKKRSWLVIWEAGVIVELPPWVAILYPSSLFYHFNVDLEDLEIITTPDGTQPTAGQDYTDCQGRGSMVFFNQGAMFQCSETGHDTLRDAKEAGHSGFTSYGDNIRDAFLNYAAYRDLRM